MKNNILITITDINLIEEYKKLGITNYAYPLSGYTVGIPNTFFINDIKYNGYLYINAMFDNKMIDNIKSIKDSILSNHNIEGIIFNDIGLIEVFKDTRLKLILNNEHQMNSYKEVKEFKKYVHSVILSTDITKEEIKNILSKDKDVCIFTFGLVSSMYSRRYLIKNYTDYYKYEYTNKINIENNNDNFIVYENNLGTVIYYDKYLYDEEILNYECLYKFYHPIFLNNEEILKVLNNDISGIRVSKHFLENETVFKVKGEIK